MPVEVADFASDENRYVLTHPSSLHDAWIEQIAVSESRDSDGTSSRVGVTVRLLGQMHDRHIILTYEDVRNYSISGGENSCSTNQTRHGDIFTHEVRLSDCGRVVHEIAVGDAGRIEITCATFNVEEREHLIGELAPQYLTESFRECSGFVGCRLVFNIYRCHTVWDASHLTFCLKMISVLTTWRRLNREGMSLKLSEVLSMLARKTWSAELVEALKINHREGLQVPIGMIEAHALCGGSSVRVLEAMQMAKHWNLAVTWDRLCAIDVLDNKDPRAEVEKCVSARARESDLDFDEWTTRKVLEKVVEVNASRRER